MTSAPTAALTYQAPAGTRIGHIHLQVTDLDCALAFYQGVLGFALMQRYGAQAAFLSAGGYHHHIGLNTCHSRGGRPAQREGAAGLYHAAILYPTRADLGRVLRRLQEAGYPLAGAADHGVSEALYLDDPDGNGLELYWDRPETEWPRAADGSLVMYSRALDVASLLAAGGGKSE